MKRSLLLLFFLFLIPSLLPAQYTMDDIPLSWNDFRKVPGGPENYKAYTAYISASITGQITYKDTGSGRVYYLVSECRVNRNNSIVDADFMDKASTHQKFNLLRHEKGHLAITLIQYARFLETVRRHKFGSCIRREADTMLSMTYREIAELYKAYDMETGHGVLETKQALWEQKLLNELNALYADSKFFQVPLTTPLYVSPGVKITDPFFIDYSKSRTAFNYHVAAAADLAVASTAESYKLTRDEPLSDGMDSIFVVDNIDFDRDFEIEVMVKIPKSARRYKAGIGIYWGMHDSLGGTPG